MASITLDTGRRRVTIDSDDDLKAALADLRARDPALGPHGTIRILDAHGTILAEDGADSPQPTRAVIRTIRERLTGGEHANASRTPTG